MKTIDTSTATWGTDPYAIFGSYSKRVSQRTSEGYVVVFYYKTDTVISFKVSADDGKTWINGSVVLTNDVVTSHRFTTYIDEHDDIYLITRKVVGLVVNCTLVKLTHGVGPNWSVGTPIAVDFDGLFSNFDIAKDASGRLWIVYSEYNFTTSTQGDLVVRYSDDDGTTWSAKTVLQALGSEGAWFIQLPSICIRDGKPIVVFTNYRSIEPYISLFYWTGSAWSAKHSFSVGGIATRAIPIVIGLNVYIAYYLVQGNRNVFLIRWNGSFDSSNIEVCPASTMEIQLGTDGTDLYIATLDVSHSSPEVYLRAFLTKYIFAEDRIDFVLPMYFSATANTISAPFLTTHTGGVPVIVGAMVMDGVNTVLSYSYNPNFGIKIAKSGFDVKTASMTELSLSSKFGSLFVVAKAKTTMNCNTAIGGGLYGGSKTVTIPNTGKYPLYLVYAQDEGGRFRISDVQPTPYTPDTPAFSLTSKVENTQLNIQMVRNSSAVNLPVYYYVFDKGILNQQYEPNQDYGFKVANHGQDIDTRELTALSLSSRYILPQIVDQKYGVLTFQANDVTKTVDFPHGLPYLPTFSVAFRIPHGSGYAWYTDNFIKLISGQGLDYASYSYINTSNIILTVVRNSGMPFENIYYRVFLYKDI